MQITRNAVLPSFNNNINIYVGFILIRICMGIIIDFFKKTTVQSLSILLCFWPYQIAGICHFLILGQNSMVLMSVPRIRKGEGKLCGGFGGFFCFGVFFCLVFILLGVFVLFFKTTVQTCCIKMTVSLGLPLPSQGS